MAVDQAVEVGDRHRAQLDPGHALQIIERDRLAANRLLPPELRTRECTRNAVQQGGDACWIRISLVKRTGEQRASERPLVHVRPLSKGRELLRMLRFQGHVEATSIRCHAYKLHETTRAV